MSAVPLALRVIEEIWHNRDANTGHVLRITQQANPDYHAPSDPKFAEAVAHVREHFDVMLALTAGGDDPLPADPLAFVRAHGIRRARQQFPLPMLLQAYRAGQEGMWMAMEEQVQRLMKDGEEGLQAALLLADYAIAYNDLISVVVTEAYLEEERQLAARRLRLGIAVLDDMLSGRSPREEAAVELCERAGLLDGRCMVVVVVRDTAGGRSLARESAALMRELDAALPPAEFGRLVDIRFDEVVGIVSSSVDTGHRVAALLRNHALPETSSGTGIRVGIGLDVVKIAELPQSYAEAVIALRLFAGERSVVHLAEADLVGYLSHTADATARRLVPRPIELLISGDTDGELVRTLRAFAGASLNVKLCARRLGVHVNTVYHRLNRIRRVTGIDPRTYSGVSSLTTALAIASRPPDTTC